MNLSNYITIWNPYIYLLLLSSVLANIQCTMYFLVEIYNVFNNTSTISY